MKTALLKSALVVAFVALGAFSAPGLIPDDADGDGVPDSVDVCPGEDASGFDRDGDGCIDEFIGARHIEYWGVEDATITYLINDVAAPNITNGTDIIAIQNAVAAWTGLADTDLNVVYGGTTSQAAANGMDGVNLVTFVDNSFPFSSFVLAVGLSTSFETDTVIDGRVYRPGEIFDADMVFNPTKTFKAGGTGLGTDIQSVATHEAGHLWGISHSAVTPSTMFYVLPSGEAARTLELDDQLVYFKAYGTETALAAANRIDVQVDDGQSSLPVPGVIVFVTDAVTDAIVACDYTLPDGSATFPGLPDGDYYVSIHALDGTSDIGFIQPGNVNVLLEEIAVAAVVAESFDASESNSDDPSDRDAVSVDNTTPVASVTIITNIDATAPTVVSAVPADNATNVGVDAAYVIEFSEPVDIATIGDAFSYRRNSDLQAQAGNIALLRDDTRIVFTPSPPLAFGEAYTLRLDTDLEDKFGNPLASDFTLGVTTEPEPPLAISSLSPNKGIIGNTVVINGAGFDGPTVSFNGAAATVVSGNVNHVVVEVPGGASTGPVTVTNADLTTSNSLTFTVLSPAEVARGFDSGQVVFDDVPRAIALVPDASYAYVATDAGAEAVVVDPALTGYLSPVPIPYPNGFDDVAATPTGKRVYGVSGPQQELVEVMSDPSTGLVFNTVLSSHDVGGTPKGIVIEPTGTRAYVATDESEVIAWDIKLGSLTYQEEVGSMASPGGASLEGAMALTPAGDRLLVLTDTGNLLFFSLPDEAFVTQVAVGADPEDVIVDPQGERAYVTHGDGDVSVVNLQGTPFEVQDIGTGGSLRGAGITPGGSYLYASDRNLDNLKIIDLVVTNGTFRSVVEDIEALNNPVAVAISPDGVYAFSVLQGGTSTEDDPRLLVTTIGLGPQVRSIYPTAARVGDIVVIDGTGFGDPQDFEIATVDFNGVTAAPQFQAFTQISVMVPTGATTGPVHVNVTLSPGTPEQRSNSLPFQILTTGQQGTLHFAGAVAPPSGVDLEDALAITPAGDLVCVGASDGSIVAFDTRPGSPTFHKQIAQFKPMETAIEDLAITADGKSLLVVASDPLDRKVPVVNVDRNDPQFGQVRSLVVAPTGNFVDDLTLVETSPNGRHALVYDRGLDWVWLVDLTGHAENQPPATVNTIGTSPGVALDLAFHATGLAAYIALTSPEQLLVVDMNDAGIQFGLVEQAIAMPGTAPLPAPFCIVPLPNGPVQLLATNISGGPVTRVLVRYGTGSDGLVTGQSTTPLETGGGRLYVERFRLSPRGADGVRVTSGNGIIAYQADDPITPRFTTIPDNGIFESLSPNEFEYTANATRMYMASTFHSNLRTFTHNDVFLMAKDSGDLQNGVVNQVLSAPVRVIMAGGSFAVDGVPVTFRVTSGGGSLVAGETLVNEMVVSVAQSTAEVQWRMGPTLGEQTLEASSVGVALSPVTFIATAFEDPNTLPLSRAEVLPTDGSFPVSATTAVLATFSRAVDPTSVGDGTMFVRSAADATHIPVAYGFTDGNRKVSMTPITPLAFDTDYRIEFTAGIQVATGFGLTNPGFTTFRTQSPPPLAIRSIYPPSALVGVTVVIAGTSFDPVAANNVVTFNGVAATPLSGTTSSLFVRVPATALSGEVRVSANAQTSNPLAFNVLVPTTVPIDDVIATIGAGSSAKSVVISADGALCYTVSTDGDVIVPVDIEGQTTFNSIQVGDQPVAIVLHPNGKLAYVANFNSGTVSVIDVDPASPTFHTVVETVAVGTGPIDVAVTPDGARVVVANATSNNVSVIDGDPTSLSHNQVVSTITAGSSAKSVVISADGTLIYVGTDTGYVVIATSSYGVVSTITTGSSAKSVVISADGALLFILTTTGTVLVVDIASGSPTANQVVATIGAGSSAKSIVISADGSLLYIVQEDSSEVLVVAIEVIPGVGAADGAAPSFTVQTRVVGTLQAGDDPSDVAVDPSGSGRVIVANAGDGTVTVFGPGFGLLEVSVRVTPRTLNLKSNGKYVTGHIELPAPYQPQEIVVSSVTLQGVIPAVIGKETIEDTDGNGIDELVVKFDRAAFQAVLPQGEFVLVTIEGVVRNRPFFGEDTIRTLRPTVTHPHGGSHAPGSSTVITWTTPSGYSAPLADVHFSSDNGETWEDVALQIPNTGSIPWAVPELNYAPECRVMVTLWKDGEIFGHGMNQDPFLIGSVVPVRLKSFDVTMENGTAVLRWETSLEVGMQGYDIVRSETELGRYDVITKEMVPSSGAATGGSYEYRDETITANRTYWYKLREVADDGLGAEYGPYAVTYRLANQLDQNVPNPFNPTTTIGYAIAGDNEVSLVIYDVAGRKVRTLVNERQRANVYRVTWDGMNDAGVRTASGVYFYKLVAGKFTQTKKMLLLK